MLRDKVGKSRGVWLSLLAIATGAAAAEASMTRAGAADEQFTIEEIKPYGAVDEDGNPVRVPLTPPTGVSRDGDFPFSLEEIKPYGAVDEDGDPIRIPLGGEPAGRDMARIFTLTPATGQRAASALRRGAAATSLVVSAEGMDSYELPTQIATQPVRSMWIPAPGSAAIFGALATGFLRRRR